MKIKQTSKEEYKDNNKDLAKELLYNKNKRSLRILNKNKDKYKYEKDSQYY